MVGTQYILQQKTEKGIEYTYHDIVYDFKKAYKTMVSENLSPEYIEVLISRLLHNIKLLPEAEKRLRTTLYILENKEKDQHKTI